MGFLDAPSSSRASVNRAARAAYRAMTDQPFPRADAGALHPTPPTVTHGTSQPLTGTLTTYSFQDSRITPLGLVPVITSGTYLCSDGTGQGLRNQSAWGFEFYVNGTDAVIYWRATPDASAQMLIQVDDLPLSAGPAVPAGITVTVGGSYYTQIHFAAAGLHKITVYWQGCGLYNLFTPVTTQVFPVQRRRLKVAVIGGSFSQQTGYYGLLQAWPWEFGRLTGFEVLQAAIGGSGYVVGSTYGSTTRVSAVAAWAPDLLLFEGSGNDDAQAGVQAAAAALYAAYATALPNVPAIVVGAMPRGASATLISARGDNLAAVKAAATAAPNVMGFIDPVGYPPSTATAPTTYAGSAAYSTGALVIYNGAVWSANAAIASSPATFDPGSWTLLSWLTGTGYSGASAGDGPRDVLVGADNTHPTVLGCQSFAGHVAREVRKVLVAAAA